MTSQVPPKQDTAFPEVGILRKGGPKEKGKSKDGREIEVLGKDLNDRFRSVFHPGTADVQKKFFDVYQTFTPPVVRAMMPFRSVWRNWTCFYEAHQGGCMIAKADKEHVLSLRHPMTKEYIVRDGQPFTAFTPGDKFEFNGQPIKFKPVGRLRLFLPDLQRFVTFLLKTTSFYDRLNVEQNLAAIQAIADAINNGNAAGIPFVVYRRETEIPWKQSRVKKWLIYVEIDPESEWSQRAMQALLQNGLSQQLLAPPVIETSVGDLDDEEDDSVEDNGVEDDGAEDGAGEDEDEVGMEKPDDPADNNHPAGSEHPADGDPPADGKSHLRFITIPPSLTTPENSTPKSPISPTGDVRLCETCGEKSPLHKPGCASQKSGALFYLDKSAVDMKNTAEVEAYNRWVKLNPGQRPSSRQALRDWVSSHKESLP